MSTTHAAQPLTPGLKALLFPFGHPADADDWLELPTPGRPGLGDDPGMGALLRFKSMMGQEGLSVHVARMCYDRLYAYERIACAQASAHDPLRRLALELFQAYHRRDEARQLST
jgi:hypothetical protein